MDALRIDQTTGLESVTPASLGTLRRGSVLAYVDLVHFQDRANAPFGHAVGNSVLAAVGRRLTEGLAPWRVFRSAGDEFTIEVAATLDSDGAEVLADRIAGFLAGPFEETGEGLEATVGVCLRAVGDDPLPVWAAALRGADTEAPRRGLRYWVTDEPE